MYILTFKTSTGPDTKGTWYNYITSQMLASLTANEGLVSTSKAEVTSEYSPRISAACAVHES
jgi:hypothetical protein